jgi:hypothetical protein
MSFLEKVIFFAGLVLIWGYPLIFMIADFQLFLLTVYVVTAAGFFMTLRLFLCSQCMNFACPLNTVKNEIRRDFYEHNPSVAKAWKVKSKH